MSLTDPKIAMSTRKRNIIIEHWSCRFCRCPPPSPTSPHPKKGRRLIPTSQRAGIYAGSGLGSGSRATFFFARICGIGTDDSSADASFPLERWSLVVSDASVAMQQRASSPRLPSFAPALRRSAQCRCVPGGRPMRTTRTDGNRRFSKHESQI